MYLCAYIYKDVYANAFFSLSLTLHWTFHFKRIGRSVSNPIVLLLGLADIISCHYIRVML